MMTRLVAALLWLAWFVLASATLAIRWLHADPHLAQDLLWSTTMLMFVTTGAVLVAARPRNRIGWLLGAMAVFDAQDRLGLAIAGDLPQLVTAAVPLAVAVALTYPVGQLLFGLIPIVLLVFPDGRLLSPRWRFAAVGPIGMVAAAGVVSLLAAGPIRPFGVAPIAKPFGIEALTPVAEVLMMVSFFSFVFGIVLGVVSLFRRFRRGGGVQRQQVKWMAASASLIALYFLSIPVVEVAGSVFPAAVDRAVVRPIQNVVNTLAAMSLPLAIGVAILRYRLYDIDVLIRRTLIYAAVSVTLAGTYFGGVLLLHTALRPLIGGSEVPVALSTLAVVALFAPLRQRIQQVVDRRFYRSRYDAARTLDAFGARLRDEVDLEAVRGDLLAAVHDTVRPAHASVWLREAGR